MMGMEVPYESTGRREQKSRTREALVAATRQLMADGTTPTVEDAAAAARISRTTAYRYFPNQRALLLAAHPQIQQTSLLPEDAPSDVESRLDLVMREFTGITVDWEPQLRASLRLSLQTGTEAGAGQPVLRQGRAIGWIEDALAPLGDSHPAIDRRRLAVAIRSATGIESLIWLTDIACLTRDQAADMMRWSARAMLHAALTGVATAPGHP
jgi:AcrR family transcriptional regulator